MSEQQGQEPAADNTNSTSGQAAGGTGETTDTTTSHDTVDVVTSEDVSAQQALADAAQTSEPAAATEEPAAKSADEPKVFDEAYVRKLRDEAAANRVKAKEEADARTAAEARQQEQLDAIAKALGLKDDEEAKPPTVEDLTEQLTTAQQTAASREAELRTLRVETAAAKAARKAGADVDSLLDSRSFADKLGDLDPSADDFTEALDALVVKTVEDNPKYKAQGPAPVASSGDFSGGSGDKPPTRNDIDDFRKARKARSGIE